MAPPPSVLLNRQNSARSPRNLQRSPRFASGWTPRKPGAGQSMFVVDPKTLATRLLIRPSTQAFEDTNSKLVSLFIWLKGASERWFSHVLLLFALIAYACVGGAVFNKIEGGFEDAQNAKFRELHVPVEEITNASLAELWSIRTRFLMPPAENDTLRKIPEPPVDLRFSYYANLILDRYAQVVHHQCEEKVAVNIESFTETDEWNFMGSCFFSMAVFTTIGYGDRTPVTTEGKVATMIYSFFGIPLLLIVLADYGKIFTKWIKWLVLFVRRLYYNRNLSKMRRMGRKATKAGQLQDALIDGFAKIQRHPPFYVDPNTGKVTMWPSKKDEESLQGSRQGSLRRGGPPRVVVSPDTPASGSAPSTPIPPEALMAFEDIDDDFNLPVSLALFILLLYLFLGAVIFWFGESWSLFHSFYFVFISMSTIGFGDFVPNQYRVMFYAAIYLIFGLTLTSMCINVIQEKLSRVFEEARLTIGESIGLDPTTPITMVVDDPERKASKESNQSAEQNNTNKPAEKTSAAKDSNNKKEQKDAKKPSASSKAELKPKEPNPEAKPQKSSLKSPNIPSKK